MEMGEIVKGSAEAALIEAMADRRLPIFILPIPLAGISSPVYPIAAAALAAAEILGVWAAAKALREDCPVQARCCSGVLNPATGAASFATPETMLIDLAVAQLFRERYGLPCGTGVGLIDAPIPGALSVFERTCKVFASALAGEPSFPVGIIGGAVVFSPEQVLLDLDIAAAAVQYLRGIGGLHLDTDHTAAHFRECLQLPAVFTRLKSTDVRNALAHDPVELAYNRVQDILARTPLYSVGQDQTRAIDRVVREAEKVLGSITGAME